ncbi:CRAL/TRIO domain-containing protein [Apiospora kogelbergensis]|uniref:CRAL/TRIO domain-containing protein n=1 Tax=Apiospora kogelbergensis TaxID=1337665 RepID=A0AAW0QK52_9PEZI
MAEKAAAGPVKVPFTHVTADSKPIDRLILSEEQEKKYAELLAQVKTWTEVPSTKDKGGPLTDDEKQWLTQECLLRFLRAVKWNLKDAEKRLIETLTWRREFGVDELTADHISPENETGKQLILGWDKHGRTCQYLSPGRQNTDVSPRQTQHLVYMLERSLELMPPGQEKVALLINMKASKNRSNTAPGISQGREVLSILQTHYPERLGRALIINGKHPIQDHVHLSKSRLIPMAVPFMVWGFFKLITPFIDPITREKIKYNEDMSQYVPKDQLWKEFGGEADFEYDHATYWPALTKMCEERRAERKEKWELGGKHIGELEDYLAGGIPMGIAPPSAGPVDDSAQDGVDAASLAEKLKELKVDEPPTVVLEENKAEEAK